MTIYDNRWQYMTIGNMTHSIAKSSIHLVRSPWSRKGHLRRNIASVVQCLIVSSLMYSSLKRNHKSQQTPDKDENVWAENSWRRFQWSVQFLNSCNITMIITNRVPEGTRAGKNWQALELSGPPHQTTTLCCTCPCPRGSPGAIRCYWSGRIYIKNMFNFFVCLIDKDNIWLASSPLRRSYPAPGPRNL